MHLPHLRALGGLLSALALTCAVQAQQVVSYLTSINPALSLPAAAGSTLQLPGFDPALGQLTGVTFTFTGFAAQLARGENIGAASSYSYNVSSTLTLGRDGGPALFAFAPVTISGSGNLAAFDGVPDFAGASAFSSTLVTTPITGIHEVSAALLSSYLGLVPIDFTAQLAGSSLLSSSGNMFAETTNTAGGTLKVDYTYALIPEPSVYAACAGFAALGAAALRRRRAPA